MKMATTTHRPMAWFAILLLTFSTSTVCVTGKRHEEYLTTAALNDIELQHHHELQQHHELEDRRQLESTHLLTLKPVLDATIIESSPTVQFGHTNELQFISVDDTDVESIVQFDISTLGEGDEIKSARLRLHANSKCSFNDHALSQRLGLLSVGLAAYTPGHAEREEMFINWENAPHLSSGTLVQPLGRIKSNRWFEMDITTLVFDSFVDQPSKDEITLRIGSVIFASVDASVASCAFISKEYRGRFAPRLVLSVETSETTTAEETEPEAKGASAIYSDVYTDGQITVSKQPPPRPEPQSSQVAVSAIAPLSSSSSDCAPKYKARTYDAGEMTSNNGKNYECKPHPYTSWCSIDAYAPGVGSVWYMAWKLRGNCEQAKQGLDILPTCPPSWQMRRVYNAGEMVTSTRSSTVFACKEFPFSDSCGDPASNVEIGPMYKSVWRVVGRCENGNFVADGVAASGGTSLETTLSLPAPTSKPTRRPRPAQGSLTSTGNVQLVDPAPSPTTTASTNANAQACGPSFSRKQDAFSNGEVVSNERMNYKCNSPQWCDVPKFEPGEGKYWTLVWEKLGECTVVNDSTSAAGSVSSVERPTGSQPSSVSQQNVNGEPPCPQMWTLNYAYAEGETVGANGQMFRCKGYPQTPWCGLSPAYEPSVGAHWDMAWDVVGNCHGQGTRPPTSQPSRQPSSQPSPKPTKKKPTTAPSPKPTKKKPTNQDGLSNLVNTNNDSSQPSPKPTKKKKKPTNQDVTNNLVNTNNDLTTTKRVFSILDSKRTVIDDTLFLYQGSKPSTVYRYQGFIDGLRIMVEDGVAGKYYYLGNDDPEKGHLYGLVNIAAFIGQSMKETIQYDACDENSWDLVNGRYPLSNACGQLGQSYQDYHCPDHEKHMECKVDPQMSIKATTHAQWYGAPGPLFCGPKSEYKHVGIWDYSAECNRPWADPPQYCTDYEGQKAGKYDNSKPVANRNGRTDVEGCCWWGRGVIQTTGICNFGKLNYFLGKRAADEGRDSRYPEIDFCQDPGIICSSEEHKELKWMAGMFYWIESLQSYDERGWNYIDELHKFVDEGMTDHTFINAVSGIVNRGCHDPPCGTGPVDGEHERAGNFQKVLSTLTA